MKKLSYRNYLDAGIDFTAWMFCRRENLGNPEGPDAKMRQFAEDTDCDWDQMIDLVVTKNESPRFKEILRERLSTQPSAFEWFEAGSDTVFAARMANLGPPADELDGMLSGLLRELQAVRVRINSRDEMENLLRKLRQEDITQKGKILSRLVDLLRDEAMAQDNVELRSATTRKNNPWVSGSFYLLASAVVIVLLLVVAKQLSILALPIVIIGAILVISIVGALQLKNDDKLKEESFLKLMGLSFRYLPLLRRRGKD